MERLNTIDKIVDRFQLKEISTNIEPTLMYQSTLTLTMSGALAFKGKGQWILDDVDNMGILRLVENKNEFGVTRQWSSDKTGKKHCRPLYLYCPDSFMAPNLSLAKYHDLDKHYPIAKISKNNGTTVRKFIRASSNKYNVNSLYGPNKAVVGITMAEVGDALKKMINIYRNSVLNSLVHENDKKDALERFDFLFGNPDIFENLNDYSSDVLSRLIKKCFNRDIVVKSFTYDFLKKKELQLYQKFAAKDQRSIEIYNKASILHGSHTLNDDAYLPYYKVNLKTGFRDFKDLNINSNNEVLVNKILALEGIKNLAYESEVMEDEAVKARDYSYNTLPTQTNQVFYETNWLEALHGIQTVVKVPELFVDIFGYDKLPLEDFANLIIEKGTEVNKELDQLKQLKLDHEPDKALEILGWNVDDLWKKWVFKHTIRDLMFSKYPPLFFSIGGDHWVNNLKVTRCYEYHNSIL